MRLVFVCFVAAVAFAAVPVAAQPKEPSQGVVSYYPEKPSTFRKNAKAFERLGQCLIANARDESEKFVIDGEKLTQKKGELLPIPRATIDGCLPAFGRLQKIGGDTSTIHYIVGGAIADALVDDVDFVSLRIEQGAIDYGYAAESQVFHKTMMGFADCVLIAAPSQVGQLLKSQFASDAEKAALESLGSTIARCNTVSYKGNISMFRPALALVTYRRVVANKRTTGAPH